MQVKEINILAKGFEGHFEFWKQVSGWKPKNAWLAYSELDRNQI